jgi:hypothetical protein
VPVLYPKHARGAKDRPAGPSLILLPWCKTSVVWRLAAETGNFPPIPRVIRVFRGASIPFPSMKSKSLRLLALAHNDVVNFRILQRGIRLRRRMGPAHDDFYVRIYFLCVPGDIKNSAYASRICGKADYIRLEILYYRICLMPYRMVDIIDNGLVAIIRIDKF